MHRPAPHTRRPTSNPATALRGRRGPAWDEMSWLGLRRPGTAGIELAVGRGLRSRVLAALTWCVFGALVLAAPAASATAPTIAFVSPSPAEGATVTMDSIGFEFTYNRKPNATATLVCALSGPTSSSGACDAPVAAGAKGSRSGKSYSGLANGDYTFTVTLALTDGGTATATRRFSVDAPARRRVDEPAPRNVYWSNYDPDTIGRANLDGTGDNPSFITGASGPQGVAVDGSHVYWTNVTGAIGRANLDGTGANHSFITGASEPEGVAVDGSHVYWANFGTDTIGRANLDGTGASQNFITGAAGIVGVAVNGSHVYWTNITGTIGRANLDGTGANHSFITGASGPQGVAVDGSHVYWANIMGTIGRANLDGTGANQNFITGAFGLRGVAADGSHVYWTNDFTDTIGRANLDGTGANQNFITGAYGPTGVAVDGG
jgi:virginiamycin B lyase